MKPEEENRKIAAALREKIRDSGLTEEQVAERAGIGRDELREILEGPPELLVRQVHAALAAIGVPPLEFYLHLYGPPRAPIDDIRPNYETLRRLVQQLQRKGIFTREQSDRLTEELGGRLTFRKPSF